MPCCGGGRVRLRINPDYRTTVRYSDYFVFFGLVSLVLGILGFVKAKSRASLFAGGVSGVLRVVAGMMALKNPPVGYVALGSK